MPQPGAKLIGEHFASQASQLCRFGSLPPWKLVGCAGGDDTWGFALVGGRHRSLKPPPRARPTLANLSHGFQGRGSVVGFHHDVPHPTARGTGTPHHAHPALGKGPGRGRQPIMGLMGTCWVGGLVVLVRLTAATRSIDALPTPTAQQAAAADAFRPDLHGRSHDNGCTTAGCRGGGCAVTRRCIAAVAPHRLVSPQVWVHPRFGFTSFPAAMLAQIPVQGAPAHVRAALHARVQAWKRALVRLHGRTGSPWGDGAKKRGATPQGKAGQGGDGAAHPFIRAGLP